MFSFSFLSSSPFFSLSRLDNSLSTKRAALAVVISTALAVSAMPLYAAGEVTTFPSPTTATGVSANGEVVVGEYPSTIYNGTEGYFWTVGAGFTGVGDLAGGSDSSRASAVSADGSTVVGYSLATTDNRAFHFKDGVLTNLGVLAIGDDSSVAYAVSADGSVVVGYSYTPLNNGVYEAFRWENNVMVGLRHLGGNESIARGVSDDGSVVVGYSTNTNGDTEAFRWIDGTGMVGLGDLAGGAFSSDAYAISGDGTVIVGFGSSTASYASDINNYEAFRWENNVMVGLGDLADGDFDSRAYAVSADGSVIVGYGYDVDGQRGVRWEDGNILTIADWLTENGVTVAADFRTRTANDVSADGNVVVGNLDGGAAFIARAGSGLISLNNVGESIGTAAAASALASRTTSGLINGAHSRPMSRRVAAGQKTAWLAGDWGRDGHHGRDGSIGLAEVGLGYNFGLAQINLSIGTTWSEMDLIQTGSLDADGKYVMIDAIVPVSAEKGIYATLSGFYHRGELDIRRGYLNAGLADISSASPDTKVRGVRARLDWQNAVSVASVNVSPYIDLSYTKTEIASYTETGGGFPARFTSEEGDITELRVGLNAAMPLADSAVTLVSNFEVAHRFEDEGPRTTGQLLGLFTVNLAGQKYDSTWLKAGVGIESKLGKGKASLMLNGTTQGEAQTAWLAASYQLAF